MSLPSTSKAAAYALHDGEEDDTSVKQHSALDKPCAFVFYENEESEAEKAQVAEQPPLGRFDVFRKLACAASLGFCFNPVKTTDFRDLVHTPGSELAAAEDGDSPYFTSQDAAVDEDETGQVAATPQETPVFDVTIEETVQNDEQAAATTTTTTEAVLETIPETTTTTEDTEDAVEEESTPAALSAPSTPAAHISPSPSSSVALSPSIASGSSTTSASASATSIAIHQESTTSTTKSSKTNLVKSPSVPKDASALMNRFKKILHPRSSSPKVVESLQVADPLPSDAANDATDSATTTQVQESIVHKEGERIVVRTIRTQHVVDRSIDTPILLDGSIPNSDDAMLSTTAPSSIPVEWSTPGKNAPNTAAVPESPSSTTKRVLSLDIRKANKNRNSTASMASTPASASSPLQQMLVHSWTKGQAGDRNSSVGSDGTSMGKVGRSSTMSSTADGSDTAGSLDSISQHLMGTSAPKDVSSAKEDKSQKRRKSVMKKLGKMLSPNARRRQGSMVLDSPVITEEPQSLDRRSSF